MIKPTDKASHFRGVSFSLGLSASCILMALPCHCVSQTWALPRSWGQDLSLGRRGNKLEETRLQGFCEMVTELLPNWREWTPQSGLCCKRHPVVSLRIRTNQDVPSVFLLHSCLWTCEMALADTSWSNPFSFFDLSSLTALSWPNPRFPEQHFPLKT